QVLSAAAGQGVAAAVAAGGGVDDRRAVEPAAGQQVLNARGIGFIGARPLGHDGVQRRDVGGITGGAADGDVVAGMANQRAGSMPGDEEVAPGAAGQDVATAADQDVIAPAADDILDVGDAAADVGGGGQQQAVGGHELQQIDRHVAGVRGVIQGVGAA